MKCDRAGFRNNETGDDGLTMRQRLIIYKKAIKMRFPITSKQRQEMVDQCMTAMKDPTATGGVRMKAAQILTVMEAINQKDELSLLPTGAPKAEPTLVFILPPNGTEAPKLLEADVMEDDLVVGPCSSGDVDVFLEATR